MRTKYTINELLFEIYLICVILGSLLRNMLGEWEPIYDTYRFVSKGRWGTFFLSFSSIIILVLIFRCFIQYIKKGPCRNKDFDYKFDFILFDMDCIGFR